MARYRVVVTAQLTQPAAVDWGRLRAVTRGSVKALSPDTLQVAITRPGNDPLCAVERAVLSLQRGLAPAATFARPPVWSARRARVPLRGRTFTGRWPIDDGDDGSAGVREPRRPIPPYGAASAALDLPT